MDNFLINDGQAVFGNSEYTYQCVIDDFKNSDFIGIMTYNISPRTDSYLLNSLKDACKNGSNAVVITNIPKRFPRYFKSDYASSAKRMIDLYISHLNPESYGMRINPYFNFNNHAKIIVTDNIAYWGSSNFSDESCRNRECGTISTDKNFIDYLKSYFFPEVQAESVSYYKYNFAVAIVSLDNLIPACREAHERLFEAAFEPWADYDTNFEEKWIYRTTASGLTVDFLRGFIEIFSNFEGALSVIENIVDEYSEDDEIPSQVEILNDLYEEYKKEFNKFNDSISSFFADLEQVARYDVSNEACGKIANDYAMEAYDEDLDYYAQKAVNEASEEYEDLIMDSKEVVIMALESLNSMVQYLRKLKENLYQLLEINAEIDNTEIN